MFRKEAVVKKGKTQVDRKPASNAYFLPTLDLVVCVQSLVGPLADPSFLGCPLLDSFPTLPLRARIRVSSLSVRAELPL